MSSRPGSLRPSARTAGALQRSGPAQSSACSMHRTGPWRDAYFRSGHGREGPAAIWHTAEAQPRTVPAPEGWPDAVGVSGDGRRIVACRKNGQPMVWDEATDISYPATEDHLACAVTVSADGAVALSGDASGTLRAWNVMSGRSIGTVQPAPKSDHCDRDRCGRVARCRRRRRRPVAPVGSQAEGRDRRCRASRRRLGGSGDGKRLAHAERRGRRDGVGLGRAGGGRDSTSVGSASAGRALPMLSGWAGPRSSRAGIRSCCRSGIWRPANLSRTWLVPPTADRWAPFMPWQPVSTALSSLPLGRIRGSWFGGGPAMHLRCCVVTAPNCMQ